MISDIDIAKFISPLVTVSITLAAINLTIHALLICFAMLSGDTKTMTTAAKRGLISVPLLGMCFIAENSLHTADNFPNNIANIIKSIINLTANSTFITIVVELAILLSVIIGVFFYQKIQHI